MKNKLTEINETQLLTYKGKAVVFKMLIKVDGRTTQVIFENGKSYIYNNSNMIVENYYEKRDVLKDDIVTIGNEIKNVEIIYYFKNYVKVKFLGNEKLYCYEKSLVEEKKKLNTRFKDYIKYCQEIAAVKDLQTNDKVKNYLYDQLKKINIFEDTVLSGFLEKESKHRKCHDDFTIYPFGINISQRVGIKNVYQNQFSTIQGPPGTGKTACILNILANLILRDKRVAVVSSNNNAVKNVLEKMQKYDYDFIISFLGKTENKELFFKNQPEYPLKMNEWRKTSDQKTKLRNDIIRHEKNLISMLEKQNELAIVSESLRAYEHEYNFFEEYLNKNDMQKLKKFKFFNLNESKIMKLIIELEIVKDKKLTYFYKLMRLIKYGIYDNNQFIGNADGILLDLKDAYYKKSIENLKLKHSKLTHTLLSANFEEERAELVEKSQAYFQAFLADKYRGEKRKKFSYENYFHDNKFKSFINEYPIMLSTTHAISKSKSRGYIFDYIIFDEASQIELVPGIIALSTAKNTVVVGDMKQLPHIPDSTIKAEQYDKWLEKYNVSEAYNYKTQSLLSSINEVFCGKIPSVQLKEHYRCHHRIIGFSNKKYYDDSLICLTKLECEKPLVLIRTVEGNHLRYGKNVVNKITNLRELDTLVDEEFLNEVNIDFNCDKQFGFIAPFRGQVNVSEEYFPEKFQKDTVHKFQGRECEIIMFSSVLDKSRFSSHRLNFVDEPKLINVAISRAKEKFILVSNVDVFKERKGEIGDLIRYMEYYEEDSTLFQSNVRSIFDLLYSGRKKELDNLKMNSKWGKSRFESENLLEKLVQDILSEEEASKYKYVREVRVKELIRNNLLLTEAEKNYVNNNARVDCVIYNKFDNQPVLCIEVDAQAFHGDKPKQLVNDEKKNSILEKYDITLLRLKTNGSNEEKKIKSFLYD